MKDQNSHGPIISSKEAATVVAAYRRSRLSLKEFARERGIRPSRLHYWVYQKSPRQTGRRPSALRARAAVPVFQEVQLSSRPEWGWGWAAEVGLPGGIVVGLSASASAEWIGSVVQTLKQLC